LIQNYTPFVVNLLVAENQLLALRYVSALESMVQCNHNFEFKCPDAATLCQYLLNWIVFFKGFQELPLLSGALRDMLDNEVATMNFS